MSHAGRWIAATAGIALVGAIGVLALRPEPVAVSIAHAERAPLAVTVEEEGRTRVQERYDVSAPIAGWSPRITLEPGDAVRVGDVLVALRPAPASALDPRARAEARAGVERARAALEAEQARLEAARATSDFARAENRRVAALHADGQVSESEVDRAAAEARRAEAALESARYAVDVARQELAAARARLEYAGRTDAPERVPVESPADGRVLAVHHESQGVVRAGEDLLTVGNPASLEVVVEVLSADAVRIRPGMPVRFHAWGGDTPLEGRVRRVEPSGFTEVSALGVEEQRVRVIADITSPFDEWRRLGDAYRVEAEFILWSGEDVLQIPAIAVFRDGDGHAVYVIRDGVARRQAVEIGHRGGLAVEIRGGLAAGDAVVLQPGDAVEHGVRVERLDGG
jgi:HlyD family secretion protein